MCFDITGRQKNLHVKIQSDSYKHDIAESDCGKQIAQ